MISVGIDRERYLAYGLCIAEGITKREVRITEVEGQDRYYNKHFNNYLKE